MKNDAGPLMVLLTLMTENFFFDILNDNNLLDKVNNLKDKNCTLPRFGIEFIQSKKLKTFVESISQNMRAYGVVLNTLLSKDDHKDKQVHISQYYLLCGILPTNTGKTKAKWPRGDVNLDNWEEEYKKNKKAFKNRSGPSHYHGCAVKRIDWSDEHKDGERRILETQLWKQLEMDRATTAWGMEYMPITYPRGFPNPNILPPEGPPATVPHAASRTHSV